MRHDNLINLPPRWRQVMKAHERLMNKWKKDYMEEEDWLRKVKINSNIDQSYQKLTSLKQRLDIRYNGTNKPLLLKYSRCECQDHIGLYVEKRRRNTSYEKEESNYLVSCIFCFEEDYRYYQDLWDDYYSSRL